MFREILVVNTVGQNISRNLSVMHIHALTNDVDVDAYYKHRPINKSLLMFLAAKTQLNKS